MTQTPPESPVGHDWETRVQNAAKRFSYPATPDIAGQVRRALASPRPLRRADPRRRLVWAALVVLILLGMLLLVSDVRAGVLKFLRIGSITIILDDTHPTPTLPPLSIPGRPTWELEGETTLDAARERVDFPIRLPAYPPDLGAPDHVYVQHIGGPLVVLVWVDPDDPSRPALSLHILGAGVEAMKGSLEQIEETTVNGHWALWTTGPYLLAYRHRDVDIAHLVEGHVLLWVEGTETYRLETDLSLEEAVRIAESLE